MKTLLLSLILLLGTTFYFPWEKPVKPADLPSAITSFVSSYFPSATITKASQERDDKDYNLKLSDGTRLEFGSDLKWSEVVTKSTIPAGVLPQEILDYVHKTYPGKAIKSIERSKNGYDIRLNGGKHFQLDTVFKPAKFRDED